MRGPRRPAAIGEADDRALRPGSPAPGAAPVPYDSRSGLMLPEAEHDEPPPSTPIEALADAAMRPETDPDAAPAEAQALVPEHRTVRQAAPRRPLGPPAFDARRGPPGAGSRAPRAAEGAQPPEGAERAEPRERPGPPSEAPTVERSATAPQLRRFIKSRAYVPMHELRRRFGLNGGDDDVTPVDLHRTRVYVGLPEREGRLLGELLRAGDIGYELSLDPISPIVVGVYPMRPVTRP